MAMSVLLKIIFVIVCIIQGLYSREIGNRLKVSKFTILVNNTIHSDYNKLVNGMRGRYREVGLLYILS